MHLILRNYRVSLINICAMIILSSNRTLTFIAVTVAVAGNELLIRGIILRDLKERSQSITD